MDNGKQDKEAYLKRQVMQTRSCAAEIIAEEDRLELLGCGVPSGASGLSDLASLHREMVGRIHPCLGPADADLQRKYRLARVALKQRNMPLMHSLYALTQHLASWDPLAGMDCRELQAELALTEALVAVERQKLNDLKRGVQGGQGI